MVRRGTPLSTCCKAIKCKKCKNTGYIERIYFDKHNGTEYEPAGEYETLYRNPCECQSDIEGKMEASMNDKDNELKPFLYKFWERINKTKSCWIWIGAKNSGGYGILRVNNFQMRAHRFSYQAFFGRISDKICVLHKCDNKICVNPEHLFLGTRIDNNKDRDMKNRTVIVYGSKNGKAKLNEIKVRDIKNTLKYYNFKSFAEIGIKYNVKWQTIQAIAKGKTWKRV